MTTYPDRPITPMGARNFIDGNQPNIAWQSPNGANIFHLMGGLAPHPGLDSGVLIDSLKGLSPPWKARDQQGANQDGVTFNSAVYEPAEVDLGVTVFGNTAQETRRVIRDWTDSWDVKQQGELSAITEAGYRYAPMRWLKPPIDDIAGSQQHLQKFKWQARIDDSFWRGLDSVSMFSGNGNGFQSIINSGDQPGWVNHVFYGPGTVAIANGAGSANYVVFGPLLGNQVALLRTEPRRRGVTDLTQIPPAAQNLTLFQNLLSQIISFASNNNVPPLLRQFESFFGIAPPQAAMYALLQGRFTRAIPAKPAGGPAVQSHIGVGISGGNGNTKLISYLTPRYRWPF